MEHFMDKHKRTHMVRHSINRAIEMIDSTLKETDTSDIDKDECRQRREMKNITKLLKERARKYNE